MTLNGAKILGVDKSARLHCRRQARGSGGHPRQPDREPAAIRNVTIVFKEGVGYDAPKLQATVKGQVGIR